MIFSKLHGFIFAAIPKTGTHAVRQALREHLGPDDLEQVRLFVEKRFPWPELARVGHGHIGLHELRPYVSEEDFAAFFKFAFVRNPFDRFVSYCAFMTRSKGFFDCDPKAVMRHFLFTAPPREHILFQPQHVFVTGPDGEMLADHIGHVEQMQESYEHICQRIGIPARRLEKVNASRRANYHDYYDQQLIDGVAKLYARDLELFSYQF